MATNISASKLDRSREHEPVNEPMPRDDEDCLIPAAQVRRLCGNVSDMTLYRWITGQGLKTSVNFPQPTKIAGRRYWWRSGVIDWLRAQEKEAT